MMDDLVALWHGMIGEWAQWGTLLVALTILLLAICLSFTLLIWILDLNSGMRQD